jgi:hypothetical protein
VHIEKKLLSADKNVKSLCAPKHGRQIIRETMTGASFEIKKSSSIAGRILWRRERSATRRITNTESRQLN